eukprot:TRINITY_DN9664_c0_g1_i1.p1 TRINITY_DN9664_c0_g1~~TRINITY_DN9664_c0_g1_i1.p1  ORF type:complete len:649 (+),score=181.26 TRINITY_DN9664_c0_g1_i1:32-1948(+)
MGNVGETTKNKFLEPLQRNDVVAVYNNFHPELKAKFDLPVLAQFVRSLNETLGAFVKADPMNIEKGVGWSSATGKSKNQGGKLIFANGTLEYSVSFNDTDQIMSFRLFTPNMNSVWLKQIETATYVERSLRMINAFYKNDNAAVTSELHPNLRRVVPPTRLQAMIESELERDELGAFISVTPDNIPDTQQTVFDQSDQESKLLLHFRIERENAVVAGTIKWVFQSMVGTIIAFEFGKNIISMKQEPKEGDGKTLSKGALQAVVDKNATAFVDLTMKSLQVKTDPKVLAHLFTRNFPGNPTESIDESLAKATETFETAPNGFKMVNVTGTLAYEQFKLQYKLVWLSGRIYEFNVSPDSTAHIKEDLEAVAKIIEDKSKLFIIKLIEMSKITESRALISPAILSQKLHELDKTQVHIREKIKPKDALQVTFDIHAKSSSDPIWKVPIKFAFGKSGFTGWIDWQLDPLQGAFITDWEIKSDAVIEWEKYNAIRAPLWEALGQHGLRVYFEKAVNLAAMDSNGFSDPYVVLSLHSQTDKRSGKVKSKIIYKSLNPVWEEMLTLSAGNKPTSTFNASDIIKVELWDKDKIVDDFLGQVHWTISEILTLVVEKGEVIMPIALKDKKDGNKAQGEVYLKFVFNSA